VPLVAKRGIEMIIGIISILCCGAQYVPVDGKVVAKETLRRVIEQSTGDLVLCVESTRRRVEDLALSGCKVVSIDGHVGEAPNMDICAFAEESLRLVTPQSGCYVIYTSGISPLHYPIHLRILLYGERSPATVGTTGTPKGVDVTHENVANLVCSCPGNLGISQGVRVGQVLNISFDMGKCDNDTAHYVMKLTVPGSGMGNLRVPQQWWNACLARI